MTTRTAGFPVFCLAFDKESRCLYAAGGGGSSKSGVENSIIWFEEQPSAVGHTWTQAGSLTMKAGAIMSMDITLLKGKKKRAILACGIDNFCHIYERIEDDKQLKHLMKFRTDFKQLTGKYDDSFQKAGKFFASGSKIATGGTDGTPRVWNVEGYSKAECMFQMEGAHADELTDVSISVDGTVFASASKRKIVLWEIKESGKQMRTISIEDQAFRSVFFIDNQLYYTLVDAQKTTTLRQCEPSTETSDYIYSFKKTPMSCVRVNEYSNFAAFGSAAGDLFLFSIKSRSLCGTVRKLHGLPIAAIACDDEGGEIFTASPDGNISFIPAKAFGQGNQLKFLLIILQMIAFLVALVAIYIMQNNK